MSPANHRTSFPSRRVATAVKRWDFFFVCESIYPSHDGEGRRASSHHRTALFESIPMRGALATPPPPFLNIFISKCGTSSHLHPQERPRTAHVSHVSAGVFAILTHMLRGEPREPEWSFPSPGASRYTHIREFLSGSAYC